MVIGFKYIFGKNYGWSLYIIKNMYKIFSNCVCKCSCGCFLKYNLHRNVSK